MTAAMKGEASAGPIQRIGVIGYGEVGKIFCAGLRPQVQAVGAWDLTFVDPLSGASHQADARGANLRACDSMADLCADAELLVSAVTASNTLAVAEEAARHLRPGTVFLDLNSASPGTKQQACACIEAAGGRYVEAGVMTSVPPHGIRVPMLLGGGTAARLVPMLMSWGMAATVVSDQIGMASAIKMCRSVMIKGLEALVIESYTTARAYGVEDHMIPTLQETFPGIDWPQVGAYFFSRMVQHGQRRAEEMRESAATVREAGFEPLMATAIADKQQWVADQAKAGAFEGIDTKNSRWQSYADRLIAQRKG